MRLYILILLLIGITVSKYHFTIYLNKGESFSYDARTSGPTLFNVTCSGTMDVFFEWDHSTKRCINVTSCDKYYEHYCHNRLLTDITMTSNTNDNAITLFFEENIGCSWIESYWVWITFLIILWSCFVLVVCCICFNKWRKSLSNDNEMIPLLEML